MTLYPHSGKACWLWSEHGFNINFAEAKAAWNRRFVLGSLIVVCRPATPPQILSLHQDSPRTAPAPCATRRTAAGSWFLLQRQAQYSRQSKTGCGCIATHLLKAAFAGSLDAAKLQKVGGYMEVKNFLKWMNRLIPPSKRKARWIDSATLIRLMIAAEKRRKAA